jgi:hypothetical protein
MTREEAAAALNGNEYAREGSQALWASMKEAGLVAVFGGSDDLMEFRGAIYDEVDAYGGAMVTVDREGLLPSRRDLDDDSELERFFARKKVAKAITAHWDKGGYSWVYSTQIPHVTFNIVEDDEMYCCGIVFALADLPA